MAVALMHRHRATGGVGLDEGLAQDAQVGAPSQNSLPSNATSSPVNLPSQSAGPQPAYDKTELLIANSLPASRQHPLPISN